MSNSADWLLRTEQIFHEVIGVPEPERIALLEARCGGDATLMLELRSLLDACQAEEAHRRSLADETVTVSEVASRVGPYAIDRLLGRGGMGTVYLAHRVDGQFSQQVAIKVIDMPLATDLFRDRFRTERQILAGLNHPYIARLLDGGVSEDGELYLAMEYVEGFSITSFCETNKLGIRERLILFRKVCEAVQYAHQNLIVHRDLKPDNILVASDGSPRLLDFGTAKIVAPIGADAAGDLTRPGFQSFTPRYASPEQVLGQPITIASDIYSLGILLYVLLAKTQPYELNEFTTEEMVKVICGQEPRRPSAAESPAGKIDSDLDSIVLKALRKEPSQRYTTVDQFASDIQAYLDQMPVLARRGNLRYRAGKFIGRNRLAIVAAGLLAASLMAGIVGVVWQARVANIQRRKAEARAADLRQLSSSLLSELDEAIKELPGSTSAQKLLVTRVMEHLDRMYADGGDDQQTLLDVADAYTRIGNLQGNAYDQNTGDPKGGLASISKAIDITERLKRTHPKDAPILHAYGLAQQARGEVLYGMGRPADAVVSLRQASLTFDGLASLPSATPLQMSEAATAYGGMGDVMGQTGAGSLGDTVSAVEAYRQALSFQRKALAVDPNFARARRSLPISMMKMANMQFNTDPWQALAGYRSSLQAMEGYPEDQKSGFAYKRALGVIERKLAVALTEVGDYPAAIKILETFRTIMGNYLKADSKDDRALVDLSVFLENEAQCYEDLADPVLHPVNPGREQHRRQAEALLEEAAADLELEAKRNPNDLSTRAILGNLQVRIGTLRQHTTRSRQGALLASRGLASLREIASPATASSFILDEISTSLLMVEPVSLRDPKAAIEYARRAVAINQQKPIYRRTLARAYRSAGALEEARASARSGLALLAPVRDGEGSTRTRTLLEFELK
jgi:tetratricopeptide (TPR) repeat protein